MFRSNQPIHPRMDIGVTGPCCPLPLTWEVDPPWDPLPLLATVRLGTGHLGSDGQDGTEPGCWDGAGGWVGLEDTAMGATGLWFVQWWLARGLCPHTVAGWDPTPKEGALQRGCGCVSMLLPTCCLRASSSPPCSSLPHPRQGLPWMGWAVPLLQWVQSSAPQHPPGLSAGPQSSALALTVPAFPSPCAWGCQPCPEAS